MRKNRTFDELRNIEFVTNYNKFYTERQIKYIDKTIELINEMDSSKVINEKLFLKNIYNSNKKYAIEWCNNYNIELR